MQGSKSRGEKYIFLLEDKDVKRWYENCARGSTITADVYLRRIGNFCKTNKTTLQKLAKMKEKELYNMLMDLVGDMEKKGFAGSYIESTLKAIKSWLAYNDITLNKKIKIRDTKATPTLKDERTPTQPELKKIFFNTNLQGRVTSIILAHSGLRIQSLGNYSGNDGLKISDMPDLTIEGNEVKFKKIPAMIKVRPELSKAGHQYFTFLSEEGCGYLADYLKERMGNGEKLTLESPIITPKARIKRFISTTNISDIVRRGLRTAGFEWRPYVLRSYFDTQLMLAESKGRVLRDYRTFWMGHKGDIEHTYTTNKGRLTPNVIEDMREAYKRSQEFLQTNEESSPKENETRLTLRKDFLCMAGYTDEEIEKMNLSEISDEDFRKNVRERMVKGFSGQKENNSKSQKVVSLKEMDNFLSKGWEFITALPDQRVVVQLSSHKF